jgi:hypothetical protein
MLGRKEGKEVAQSGGLEKPSLALFAVLVHRITNGVEIELS